MSISFVDARQLKRERDFCIGEKVLWDKALVYLEFLSPFEIREIVDDVAYLNWISSPVKLSELRKTKP